MPYVSPGVYIREFDFSQFVEAVGTTIFGVVGTAQKGPMNTPWLITNEAQFVDLFGAPFVNSMAGYAAIEYLRRGTRCVFVRVGSSSKAKATFTIPDIAPAGTLKVDAVSEGTWANGVRVAISAGTVTGTFKLIVQDLNGFQVEAYDNLVQTPSTSVNYSETRINGISRYITVDQLLTTLPAVGAYTLAGGNNGTTGIADADYIGTITGNTRTGLQCLRNPESVQLNLIAVPGVSSGAVVTAMISIVEARNDSLALVDPPLGLTVQGVIDYHNGVGYTHAAFVSNKAALYWPWVQIYDQYNSVNVFVPPSCMAAQAIAYNDSVAEPWFAPAGVQRGHILDGLSLEYSPTQGERDQMYSGGNAINPIVNFPRDGICIFGQRTLQRSASSLNRINVRRMLFFIEQAIASSARFLMFDQTDAVLWKRFRDLVEPFLETVRSRRGLEQYQVICDAATNPDYVKNDNEMRGKVYLVRPRLEF